VREQMSVVKENGTIVCRQGIGVRSEETYDSMS
jgi:hypothetical protein